MLVFLGGAPLGSPMVGWAAEQFGPRVSLFAGGAISALATVVVAALLAHARGVPARSYLRPRARKPLAAAAAGGPDSQA